VISLEDWAARTFDIAHRIDSGPYSLGRSAVFYLSDKSVLSEESEAVVFNRNGVFRFPIPDDIIRYHPWPGRYPTEIVFHTDTGLKFVQIQDPRVEL
jgi:hypothetical protein